MSSAALEPAFGERSAETRTRERESLPSEKVNELPNVWDCLSADVLFFIHLPLDAWVCQSAKQAFPFPSLNPTFPETGPRLQCPRCWLSPSRVERLWRGPRGFWEGRLVPAWCGREPLHCSICVNRPLGGRNGRDGRNTRERFAFGVPGSGTQRLGLPARTAKSFPLQVISGSKRRCKSYSSISSQPCLRRLLEKTTTTTKKALWTVIVQRVSPSQRLLRGTARKNIADDLGFFPFRSSRCKELDLKVVCYFLLEHFLFLLSAGSPASPAREIAGLDFLAFNQTCICRNENSLRLWNPRSCNLNCAFLEHVGDLRKMYFKSFSFAV